jgi:hypothetical protein
MIQVVIKARAKAFSGEGVREHRFLVEKAMGITVVRVWDSVAGHYTRCHSLGSAAVRRICELASAAH